MYWVIIGIHIIVCIILISVILLQAGRGGGLSETFGSDAAQSVLGTQAPVILKRATEASAVAFVITCIILGMMTARTARSVMGRGGIPVVPVSAQQEAPMAPASETPAVDN